MFKRAGLRAGTESVRARLQKDKATTTNDDGQRDCPSQEPN
jgi:hypothetical protein